MMWPTSIQAPPEEWLLQSGTIVERFGPPEQDSGNVSWAVVIGEERFFIKSAGSPREMHRLSHEQRVAYLHNAACLYRECAHEALVRLKTMIASPWGPLLVFDWAPGELLYTVSARRKDPASAYARFRALPAQEIIDVFTQIFSLQAQLAQEGWTAVDFYDGSMLYDFDKKQVTVIDLDLYQRGAFVNEVGRMPGSSRFMAPESLTRGALINERTHVFELGRMISVFLSDGTLAREPFRGPENLHAVMQRACQSEPEDRYSSVSAFFEDWVKHKKSAA